MTLRPTLVAFALAAAACAAPTRPSDTFTIDQIKATILATNITAAQWNANKLVRYDVPIAVNTNGIARAELAVKHLEDWSGGRIAFTRVTSNPSVGITFIDGGGLGSGQEEKSCGHVTGVAPPDNNSQSPRVADSTGRLSGPSYIHLGSDDCNDAVEGNSPSAIAEHELMHALGLSTHFDGFNGNEGFADPRAFAVLVNIYANPIGTTAANITIWK